MKAPVPHSHVGSTGTVVESAWVMDSDCWLLPEELSLCIMHMHQSDRARGLPWASFRDLIHWVPGGPAELLLWGRETEREGVSRRGKKRGFLRNWRPIDRFIWSQMATCTGICRGSTLTWGRVNAGDCDARDNISSQLPWAAVGDIFKWHPGTTYNAQKWTKH